MVGAIAIAATVMSLSANSTPLCAHRDVIIKNIERAFGEVPFMTFESGGGKFLLLTRNPKTGSWSIFLQTDPDILCLVGTGKKSRTRRGVPA